MFTELEELSDKGYEITIVNQPKEFMTNLPKWGVSIFAAEKFVSGKSLQYAWDDKLETAIKTAIDRALNG